MGDEGKEELSKPSLTKWVITVPMAAVTALITVTKGECVGLKGTPLLAPLLPHMLGWSSELGTLPQ